MVNHQSDIFLVEACSNSVSVRVISDGSCGLLLVSYFSRFSLSGSKMASGRQLSNGFYLRRSQFQRGPSAAALSTMFDNLLLDFERRLTTKIFDKNRTLTALSSEVRQTVTVENVPQLVFERCFKQQVSGKEAVIRTVAELLDVFPCHSLVRRHFAGDFCVVLPLLQCSLPISHSSLSGLLNNPLPQTSQLRRVKFS